MSSQSETGHAKNVANFEDIIAYIAGYGTIYNPSKTALKVTNLNTLFASAQAALLVINTKLPAYTNAVALREIEYQKMEKIVSRILNATRAIDIPKQELEAVEGIVRKIKAKRFKAGAELAKTANKTTGDAPTDGSAPVEESPKTISISQRSYDKRIENFTLLVQQVATFSTYTPRVFNELCQLKEKP